MKKYAPVLDDIVTMLDLGIDDPQKGQLLQYLDLLVEGLARQRLVGEKDGKILVEKHIFDCLYPLKIWRLSPDSLLDLGTGAGLPGVPLKICLPGTKLYLMDSTRRKVNFLRRVAAELALEETYFLPGRAEKWGRHPDYREQFSCVVSRAVARAAVLGELALPLVRVGGELIMYKGKGGLAEIEEAEVSLRLCGGQLERYRRYRLPTGEERTLFAIRKREATADDYPRKEGAAAKRPLGR